MVTLAWRQLGIWLAKCIDLKTNFQVQNKLLSLPKTPIAPNRCWQIVALFINLFKQFFMPKEHQIKTMNDIFKIVNSENVERFLSDFNASLFQIVAMKELLNKREQKELEYSVFRWTDDNIKKVSIKLNVKK